MNKIGKFFALAALAALVGCGGGGKSLFGFTKLRVVNASPDAIVTRVDYAGSKLSDDLGEGQSAPPAGTDPISFDSGGGTIDFDLNGTALSSSLNLVADHYVDVVLAGLKGDAGDNKVRTITVDTDPTAVSTTKANIRIVHASTAAAASVDVYVVTADTDIAAVTPTVAGLARFGTTGVLVSSGGQVRIVVTEAGTKTVILDVTEGLSEQSLSTLVVENDISDDTKVILGRFTTDLL